MQSYLRNLLPKSWLHCLLLFFFNVTRNHLYHHFCSYFTIIKKPLDMQTIGENLEDELYDTFGDFCRDVYLMFENCRQYNGPGYFSDVSQSVEVFPPLVFFVNIIFNTLA